MFFNPKFPGSVKTWPHYGKEGTVLFNTKLFLRLMLCTMKNFKFYKCLEKQVSLLTGKSKPLH